MTSPSLTGRPLTVLLRNVEGDEIQVGSVVGLASTADAAVWLVATAGDYRALGVATETIADGQRGRIQIAGTVYALIQGTVGRGDYLQTGTLAGKLQSTGSVNDATTPPPAGSCAIALEAGVDNDLILVEFIGATPAGGGGGGGITVEDAQDAVGTILLDTPEVDFTYDDATPSISANLRDNSITAQRLTMATGTLVGRTLPGFGAGHAISVGTGLIMAATVLAVDLTFSPTWSGLHTFQNQTRFVRTWSPVVEDALLYVEATVNVDNASGSNAGIRQWTRVRPTIDNTSGNGFDGIESFVEHDQGAFSLIWVKGLHNMVNQAVAASTITYGVGSSNEAKATAGTITNAAGVQAILTTDGGTITTGLGVDVVRQNLSGTMTTAIGLRVQAAAGVVGTDIAIQSLGGQNRFVGQAYFGADAAPIDPTVRVQVTVDSGLFTGTRRMVYATATFRPNDATSHSLGMYFAGSVQPAAANGSGDHVGLYGLMNVDAGAFAVGAVTGIKGFASVNVAGATVADVVGAEGRGDAGAGTGTLVTGVRAMINAGGGTITTGIGVDVIRQRLAGTLTTSIGLRVRVQSGVVSNDIAIQSLGGENRFVGSTIIGADAGPTVGFETRNVQATFGGSLTLGTANASAVTVALSVVNTANLVATFRVAPTFTGGADLPIGARFGPTFTPANSIGNVYGMLASANASPAAGVTITDARAAQFAMVYGATAGAVTNGVGFYVDVPSFLGALKPSNSYGVYIANQGAAGVTNTAGLLIAAQTGAGQNIAIWSLGGQNRFIGGVKIGADAAPAVALDVVGAVTSTLGYQYGGAAPLNALLMGNGTNYVGTTGAWTDVAHNAANFTSGSGSWTVPAGSQQTYRYWIVGKTMFLAFYSNSTTTSGTPTSLRVAVPNGRTGASYTIGHAWVRIAGVAYSAFAQSSPGGTFIEIWREDLAAFPDGAATATVSFLLTFSLQ
jgi:hypothetical protein